VDRPSSLVLVCRIQRACLCITREKPVEKAHRFLKFSCSSLMNGR
jgi:hypothetical protein